MEKRINTQIRKNRFLVTLPKEQKISKKAKTVHCNFVMDETYHQNLKLIAIRKGDSLKSVLQEAISDYLDKNSSLL